MPIEQPSLHAPVPVALGDLGTLLVDTVGLSLREWRTSKTDVRGRSYARRVVAKYWSALVEPTRKESGCLCYNLHQSKSDKSQFMFYEQWASQEALDAHGKMPYMKALRGKLMDKTEKGGGVVFYEVLK